ncbi:MAG: nicotinamide-nucleotide amidohydrolase family protein, partial [Chthoniobacterales bacterium]
MLGSRRARHHVLLPGPPRELQPMMREHVVPRLLTALPGAQRRERRIYRLTGIGESQVEERIGEKLEARGELEVGYCARPSEVDFRLIGPSDKLDAAEPEIVGLLGEWIYSRGETLEEAVVSLLRENRATLATAESCTGGALADRVTDVPGASEVFLAGYVTYANAIKTAAVGVPAGLLEAHGAVSEPVASAL